MPLNKKPVILVVEPQDFSKTVEAQLRGWANVRLKDLDRLGLLAEVQEADILWIRLRHSINAEVLENASNLRTIVSPTTGLNHIDLAEAQKRGVEVLSLQGESDFLKNIRATAEHTIGLMLMLLRNAPSALEHVKAGNWDRDLFRGQELYCKTVGLVGYGRLGRIVAQYLRAFETRILAADPYIDPDTVEANVSLVSLEDLLVSANIVSIHVKLSTETVGLIGEKEFKKMKHGSWFINTARGEVIDETALIRSLSSGHLAGAALDVLANEQHLSPQNPLIRFAQTSPRLLVTPHLGGCTFESLEATESFMAEKLRRKCNPKLYPEDGRFV